MLDFHSILKSGLLSWSSGAPLRFAYAAPFGREGGHHLATHRATLAPARASRFDRNLALVRFLGSPALPDATPFRVAPEVLRRMTASVARAGAYVVLHPGTSAGTPYKRWTPAGFGRVAAALLAQCGIASLVTYGPDETERRLAAVVVAESDGAATLAPATTTLHELAAVLARARLFVGADTGPLHIASLVGTPVVQILGATDSIENAPWRETPSRTVRVPLPRSVPARLRRGDVHARRDSGAGGLCRARVAAREPVAERIVAGAQLPVTS